MSHPTSWRKHWKSRLAMVVLASVVTCLLWVWFLSTPVVTQSGLHSVYHWRNALIPPLRDERVVVRNLSGQFVVGRVAGRPRDWVNLKDGFVYVNGKCRSHLSKTAEPTEKWIHLGRDQYYVLTRQDGEIFDRSNHGVVKRGDIIGVISE